MDADPAPTVDELPISIDARRSQLDDQLVRLGGRESVTASDLRQAKEALASARRRSVDAHLRAASAMRLAAMVHRQAAEQAIRRGEQAREQAHRAAAQAADDAATRHARAAAEQTATFHEVEPSVSRRPPETTD